MLTPDQKNDIFDLYEEEVLRKLRQVSAFVLQNKLPEARALAEALQEYEAAVGSNLLPWFKDGASYTVLRLRVTFPTIPVRVAPTVWAHLAKVEEALP